MLNVTIDKGEIEAEAKGTAHTLVAEATLLIREATNIASSVGNYDAYIATVTDMSDKLFSPESGKEL